MPDTVTGARLNELAPERPLSPWIVAATAALLLGVNVLAESGALGVGSAQTALGDLTSLALILGAGAVALFAARARNDSRGWGLIGAALLAWAAGDAYFALAIDPVEGPYPSPADLLYLGYYVLALLGLRKLTDRRRRPALPVLTLLPPLLGAATLWSWLVFDPVLGSLSGTAAAQMTSFAYPCLDLVLICFGIVALASHDWRRTPGLRLLLAGIAVTAVADSIFAAAVAEGTLPDQTPLDSLWPLAAVLIGAAAWIERRPRGAGQPDEPGAGHRFELALSVPAVAVAVAALLVDHISRLHLGTVTLAALTLAAAAARLVTLYREAERAKSEALHAERERGRVESLHTASAEAALEAIVTVDRDGRIVDWNPAAEEISGYSKREAIGRDVGELCLPASGRSEFERGLERLVEGAAPDTPGRRIEMMGRRSDGTEFPFEMTVARVSEAPLLITAFVADISDRKRREAERERLAEMVRSAEDAMYSTDRDLVLLTWNPAAERIFGYEAGEVVGRTLERIVPLERRDEFRRLIGRVGSGESVSIETTRLRSDGEPVEVALQIYPLRDELGRVASYSFIARDLTDRRRLEREHRVHRERAAWRSQIEDALEDDGFSFHRQPVLDLASGEIVQHELLLRMRIDDELVPPAKFLPHAESSPALMRRVDRWAIRRGVELAAERPVAINLSARSLSDSGVVKAVQSELERSGAEPRDVTFEITETAAAEQLEEAHALVAALRALGCGVALDDFGTGYGSFTYLLRIPVTSLKIDIEFIRALSEDPADQRVVGSILAVAQNFGLTTIAEGVETEATLRLLRRMGVDAIQGYLIGRPQPHWTRPEDLAGAVTPEGRH